jgi:hypothetical protein
MPVPANDDVDASFDGGGDPVNCIDPDQPFTFASLGPILNKPSRDEPNTDALYFRRRIVETMFAMVGRLRERVEALEAQMAERVRQRVRESLAVIEGGTSFKFN